MFDLKDIRTKDDNSAEGYVLEDKGLIAAVQMAIWLGKPLLLTGEPGTGKTQLAVKVANTLAKGTENINAENVPPFIDKPLIFPSKTTSSATDLFYYYDAVRHFRGGYITEKTSESISQQVTIPPGGDKREVGVTKETIEPQPQQTAHQFIKLNALGKAILQTWGKDAIRASEELKHLAELDGFKDLDASPRSSVVLIDEIDKAPRDFPNDLLFEIENTTFAIRELMNKSISRAKNSARIVILITSNFEKNLPDAFLRRCLFYHISFPGTDALMKIISSRILPYLELVYKDDATQLDKITRYFKYTINRRAMMLPPMRLPRLIKILKQLLKLLNGSEKLL